MLTTLALALCFQSKSKIALQEVWSVGPTFRYQNTDISVGRLILNSEEGNLQFVSGAASLPGLPLYEFLCTVSVEDGAITVGNRLPPAALSLNSQGLLVGMNGVVDPATLMPKVQFPRTSDGAIPPETVADQGVVELIWDSDSARLFSFYGVVRSYKPRTFEFDRILVGDADVPRERNFKLRKLTLVGNPDAGAFALNYRDRVHLFTNQWSRISLLDQGGHSSNIRCCDVGPNGFLIQTFVATPSLSCLDADSGRVKWKASAMDWTRWVGNYVVTANTSVPEGNDNWLRVLDGRTGQELGSVLIPPKYKRPTLVVGDLLIFETKSREFGAFRISQS